MFNMKSTFLGATIIGLMQLSGPAQDTVKASSTKDTTTQATIKKDTVLLKQLEIMSKQKDEPLTVKDTVKAVAGKYGHTVDMARRDLQRHNDTAESLIRVLDSIIQKND